jgi:hypothetical protein
MTAAARLAMIGIHEQDGIMWNASGQGSPNHQYCEVP